jgi:hypothetical protein
MIDVYAVLQDPDIPREVGQRLLTRQRARALGIEPEPCPDIDKPFLAKHLIRTRDVH